MRRLYQYFRTIVPHLWFVFTGLVPLAINLARWEGWWDFQMTPVLAVSASAGLVIIGLFYAGFRAWSEEYDRVERIWPMIGQGKLRGRFIDKMRHYAGEYQIFANNSPDVHDLASELEDIFQDLGWRRHLPIIVPSVWLQPGIMLVGRHDDRRPIALKRALQKHLGISATVAYTDEAGAVLQVHIGRRPRA